MSRLFIAEKKDIAIAMADHLWSADYERTPHFFKGKHDASGDCVTWASGHILGLAEPALYEEWKDKPRSFYPLFPSKWKLVPLENTKKQLLAIRDLLPQFDTVVNGGDADREGQLLVDEILNFYHYKGKRLRIFITAKDDTSMRRAFDSITDDEKYHSLYTAGVLRARCDWLVGMNLSRAYNAEARRSGYSTFGDFRFRIGRVKMPTLALVVKRERDIQNFKSVPYFLLKALFRKNGALIRTHLSLPEDFPSADSEGRVLDKKVLLDLVNAIKAEKGVVTSVKTEEKKQAQPLPHSLDTLQIMANKRFGMSPNKTLEIVQSLYERKLVSYPRSDCNFLPSSQQADGAVILQNLAASGIPGLFHEAAGADPSYAGSKCWNDKKVTIHTAIIPTMEPVVSSDLSQEERDIYFLIAFNYLLQFYPLHRFKKTDFTIQCGSYTFTGSGREVIEEGFRKVYQPMLDDHVQNLDEDESNVLPPLMKGDVLGVPNCAISDKKTMPPKRFTEGTLISAMANIWKYVAPDNPNRMKLKDIKGIGTPATRARIIDELLAIRLSGHPVRPFLTKKGKDLIPTDFGFFTIDHIHESLTKPDLTADIEFQLSEIVKNESLSDQTMERMIEMVKDNIAFADSSMFPPPKDAVPCPVCHKSYLARHTMKDGKGAYYRCCDPNCVSPFDGKPVFYSEFDKKPLIVLCPYCQLPLSLSKPNPQTGKNVFLCRSCTSKMHVVWENDGGKLGREITMSPKPERKEDSVDCPICHKGFLVPHVSKMGTPYFSCSDYHCAFHGERMTFEDRDGKPFVKSCPVCHSPMQHRKSKKTGQEYYVCYVCDHWFPVVDGELSFLPCPDCGRPLSVFDSKKNPGEKLYLCTNAKGHNGQEKVWFHMMDGKLVPSQRSFSVPPRDADSIDCPMCHKGYLFKVKTKTGRELFKCSDSGCEYSSSSKKSIPCVDGKPFVVPCPSCGELLYHFQNSRTKQWSFVCNKENKFFDDKNGKPVPQTHRNTASKGRGRQLTKH